MIQMIQKSMTLNHDFYTLDAENKPSPAAPNFGPFDLKELDYVVWSDNGRVGGNYQDFLRDNPQWVDFVNMAIPGGQPAPKVFEPKPKSNAPKLDPLTMTSMIEKARNKNHGFYTIDDQGQEHPPAPNFGPFDMKELDYVVWVDNGRIGDSYQEFLNKNPTWPDFVRTALGIPTP